MLRWWKILSLLLLLLLIKNNVFIILKIVFFVKHHLQSFTLLQNRCNITTKILDKTRRRETPFKYMIFFDLQFNSGVTRTVKSGDD